MKTSLSKSVHRLRRVACLVGLVFVLACPAPASAAALRSGNLSSSGQSALVAAGPVFGMMKTIRKWCNGFLNYMDTSLADRSTMIRFGMVGTVIALYIIIWRKH